MTDYKQFEINDDEFFIRNTVSYFSKSLLVPVSDINLQNRLRSKNYLSYLKSILHNKQNLPPTSFDLRDSSEYNFMKAFDVFRANATSMSELSNFTADICDIKLKDKKNINFIERNMFPLFDSKGVIRKSIFNDLGFKIRKCGKKFVLLSNGDRPYDVEIYLDTDSKWRPKQIVPSFMIKYFGRYNSHCEFYLSGVNYFYKYLRVRPNTLHCTKLYSNRHLEIIEAYNLLLILKKVKKITQDIEILL